MERLGLVVHGLAHVDIRPSMAHTRGPIDNNRFHPVHVVNKYNFNFNFALISRQSERQPSRGVVSGQHNCESYSIAIALYRIKQAIGMSDLDMY
jgi:hypothetical protein